MCNYVCVSTKWILWTPPGQCLRNPRIGSKRYLDRLRWGAVPNRLNRKLVELSLYLSQDIYPPSNPFKAWGGNSNAWLRVVGRMKWQYNVEFWVYWLACVRHFINGWCFYNETWKSALITLISLLLFIKSEYVQKWRPDLGPVTHPILVSIPILLKLQKQNTRLLLPWKLSHSAAWLYNLSLLTREKCFPFAWQSNKATLSFFSIKKRKENLENRRGKIFL